MPGKPSIYFPKSPSTEAGSSVQCAVLLEENLGANRTITFSYIESPNTPSQTLLGNQRNSVSVQAGDTGVIFPVATMASNGGVPSEGGTVKVTATYGTMVSDPAYIIVLKKSSDDAMAIVEADDTSEIIEEYLEELELTVGVGHSSMEATSEIIEEYLEELEAKDAFSPFDGQAIPITLTVTDVSSAESGLERSRTGETSATTVSDAALVRIDIALPANTSGRRLVNFVKFLDIKFSAYKHAKNGDIEFYPLFDNSVSTKPGRIEAGRLATTFTLNPIHPVEPGTYYVLASVRVSVREAGFFPSQAAVLVRFEQP